MLGREGEDNEYSKICPYHATISFGLSMVLAIISMMLIEQVHVRL